ncbi:type 2 lanthipeptide synthetase LanM family protein [Streptomyces roseoverticillatus]|uniref:type 2 lanthipeptide synthetase LanM family protein n=1 Tax=Streptomyces roseoverticillatus TaxID=66429 RepID=UPI0004C004A9|nr:type 2 lanthipeptide synthetase LanM family protein [Streptomyces roseoverticillatus]
MATAAYPMDLAARASNLAERIRVVNACDPPPGPLPPGGPDAFDTWRTGRLAAKLADKFAQEAAHRSVPPQYSKDELVVVLSAYRRIELGLGDAPGSVRDTLAEVHASWLPTYRAALDAAGGRPDGEAEAFRRDPGVYYGKLAIACAPFLAELGRRLRRTRANLPGRRRALLSERLVEDFQRHLLQRFEMALAWAVEADAKVHCELQGIDAAGATREEYIGYLDLTFADPASYHAFYLKYPVLGRWLAHVTALLGAYGEEVFHHLATDAGRIGEAFFGRRTISAFTSFEPGGGDYHAGARSVARVRAELGDGSTETFCYKPRSVRAEAGLQELLRALADDGVLGFAPRAVLPMGGYGYEALIPSGRNEVATVEQAAAVYRELGGYLGVFYVLGGSDLHHENIMVADGHAFVCDAETVLGITPRGQGQPDGTLIDSVFKTGLLERPRDAVLPAGPDTMRISGYAGGEDYEVPMPVPRIGGDRLSFQASVAHVTGARVPVDPANRVVLGGELVRPEDHADAVTEGFERVYAWFQRSPEEAARRVAEALGDIPVRFVNWSTQIYQQLLVAARHPKCLAEPLEVDLLANTVRTFPRTWDHTNVLAERESRSLWQLDIPLFSARARGTRLVHDHTDELTSPLELSPLDEAIGRIGRLTDHNRVQQTHYITASLVADGVADESFVRAATDYAARTGDRLLGELRPPGAASPWTSYELADGSVTVVDIEADLYLGTAGIALFLAYLDDAVPREEFRAAAERAAEHAVVHCDRKRPGAFGGIGGTIYLLTHLHHLWKDERLLDQAVRLTGELPALIEADRHLDVFQGAAGLIPVLLGLADATGGHGIELAHRCADHVLRHAEADGAGLSWPPFPAGVAHANLTGFAHGAGGIGWALIALGRRTGREDCVTAGLKAFAYESRHFDGVEQDWYDLRTSAGGVAKNGRHYANAWCNGAAGIGLSRIASWAALGSADDTMLRDAYAALRTTVRNFPRLRNHTLCHGRSGNAELLLRVAALCGDPTFRMEANIQAQALWRDFDDPRDGAAEGSANFFPGLMLGISGFGMHCLRLAAPQRVPSVLLLDPPAAP